VPACVAASFYTVVDYDCGRLGHVEGQIIQCGAGCEIINVCSAVDCGGCCHLGIFNHSIIRLVTVKLSCVQGSSTASGKRSTLLVRRSLIT